mmetsp:Transcript_68426/g.198416  ORF Transcript_68426/g.198416 Transcript_68426/m.198416 type:complete len:269 (-) Transcript_68426:93-899(-)
MLGAGPAAVRPNPLRRLKAIAASTRTNVSKRYAARPVFVPGRISSQLRHGDLLFVSEPLNVALPLERAIREVGLSTIRWLKERGGVNVNNDATAEHVAMVVADAYGRAVSVIEAVRLLGVRVLPLEGFFAEFVTGTEFLHGRVIGTSETDRRKAVSYALLRTGASYSDDFAPPSPLATTPWSQSFYCSSLADYAYRSALGKELVFTDEPFPLMFEPRTFWEDYYKVQGLEIPEGYGSNPTLLLHSDRVAVEKLDFTIGDKNEEFHEMF